MQCLPRFSRALILAAFPVEERTGKFPQSLHRNLHRAFHDTGAHAHLALCKKREKRTSSAAQPVSAPDAPVVPGEQSALHRGNTRIRRFLRRKYGNEHAAGFFQRADDRGKYGGVQAVIRPEQHGCRARFSGFSQFHSVSSLQKLQSIDALRRKYRRARRSRRQHIVSVFHGVKRE